ncbi:MAG: hypothetical protein Q8M08_08325 [Bacteroidales bacterium]|nr:hypothetical protein [Bacteroidales bacterium]
MKIKVSLFLCFFLSLHGFSQYFSAGQDPASIRWQQIKTDRYQIIFPEPFEKKAQYLANIMDIICRNATTTLSSKVPRMPVVLHSHSVISNGLTVWAPRRIELYTCPPQNTYAEEWLEQLAIHEYRHAVQISKINRGFSKALYYIFGEQITGGILGLYVPSWFLEGDATVTETAMTHTGRGRSALFESTLRAQIVEKGPYSYDKATMGSYKTFTPDAYALGYYLVGQSRKKYGPELWNTALDKVARYPFMVVPFNSGIRKVTGMWKTGLYRQTLATLDSAWQQQLHRTEHQAMRSITKRNVKNHVYYDHPILLNDSTILADKSSMDDVDRYVLIDRKTGNEKILLTPGNHFRGTTSTVGSYLVWAELVRDLRWSNRNYSEIRIYDFNTGKQRSLTGKSRYFAPVLSPDGAKIAAVHYSTENQCSIDILEAPTGRLLKRHNIADGGQAITPNWSPDATKIIFTLLNENGETVAVLETVTGKISCLLPYSYNEFNRPAFFFKQYIIYSADHSGVENIYAMDTLTRETFQVTSGRFATFDPNFTSDNKHMICSDYSSDGLMVAEIPVDTLSWIPLQHVTNNSYRLYDALAAQETANIQDSISVRNIYKMNASGNYSLERDSIRGIIYPTRKYSKFLNLVNPHSWAPASFDINNLDIKPGVMLLSQNTLSTMLAGAGWEYDINEQTGKFYTDLSYRGWYPAFTFRFDIGNRAGYARYHGSSDIYRFTWQETNFKTVVSIPWNFSRGRYARYIQPSIGTTLIGVRHHSTTPSTFTNGWIQTLDYRVTTSQYLNSNPKDVYPRLGQAIDVIYRNSPFGANNMGSIFAVKANLYFPGVIRHHGIRLYCGYQERNDNNRLSYSFSNLITYPKGYFSADDNNLLSLSLNYKLPLWYPDFSIGSVIYLKRLKLNLYYDWANGKNPGYVNEYQTMGGEITADFHLLRFVAPVEMGLRSLYHPSTGGWGFEFLYSISY